MVRDYYIYIMECTKDVLEDLINVKKISYVEIGKLFEISDNGLKKRARLLGIILPVRNSNPSRVYLGKKRVRKSCPVCESLIENKSSKYCSTACAGTQNSLDAYRKYLNNQQSWCKFRSIATLKPHILREQDNKCAICQITPIWNGTKLVLIIDHIDGDATNNMRTNLRLVCPNCDSQLPTFKSKNKVSTRIRYKKNSS